METKDGGGIIIFGASRSTGNTANVSKRIAEITNFELVDLGKMDITAYDYEHGNIGDDFIPLAEKMAQAKVIILVSPVYWYSMSAQMKVFIDRWSDLVTVRKDIGRALKGSHLIAVSCSNDVDLGEGYALPFSQTAEYMAMHFAGHYHTWKIFEEDFEQKVLDLINEIASKALSIIKS